MSDKSTADILNERGASYGSYAVQAAFAQRLKDVIASQFGHRHLPPTQRESLDMFCTKISRIVCGDNNNIDSWQDIEGYAALIVKELKERRGAVHTSPSFGRQPPPEAPPPWASPIPPAPWASPIPPAPWASPIPDTGVADCVYTVTGSTPFDGVTLVEPGSPMPYEDHAATKQPA